MIKIQTDAEARVVKRIIQAGKRGYFSDNWVITALKDDLATYKRLTKPKPFAAWELKLDDDIPALQKD